MAPPTAKRSLLVATLLNDLFGEDELASLGVHLPPGRHRGHFYAVPTSAIVRALVSILGADPEAQLVDPWTQDGLLAAALVEEGVAAVAEVLSPNPEAVVKWIAPAFALRVEYGNPLVYLHGLSSKPKKVASLLPWNLKSRLHQSDSGLTDAAQQIMLEVARHLADDGVAAFVVPPATILIKGKDFIRGIADAGAAIDALFYLPPKSLAPYTSLRPTVVVIRRQAFPANKTFVGGFEDNPARDEILFRNWRAREAGESAALGSIVDLHEFRGIESLEAGERARSLSQATGLKPRPLGELLVRPPTQTRAIEPPGFELLPNAVYLPKIGRGPAVTSPAEFGLKPHNYLQLQFNPDEVIGDYLAKHLSTPLGQSSREAQLQGSTIPRLTSNSAVGIEVYLPDLATQRRILAASGSLAASMAELGEAQHRLWSRPESVLDSERLLKRVARSESYPEWLDTLPFPLASILWAHKTEEHDNHRAYVHLLHFFEALAQFLSLILLSAVHRTPDILGERRLDAISDSLKGGKVSLTVGTFGTWKLLFSYLAKNFRTLLNGKPEERERAYEALASHDDAVLGLLTSREMAQIFERANELRNWHAHGGVVSDKDAAQRHEETRAMVTEVRKLFGTAWDSYDLVLPRTARLRGGRYMVSVQRVVGRTSKFEHREIVLSTGLEEGQLHLYSQGEQSALPLLPLVRVMPSPRTENNACYFYSRTARGKLKFVSYHFEQEAELEEADEATASLIATLSHSSR